MNEANRWFGAHLVDTAREAGDRTALICPEHRWTYQQLDRAIARAVTRLRELGVVRGDRVVMQGRPRAESVVTLFAVTRMGAVLVPVHPQLTNAEVEVVVQDVRPRVVVADHAPLAPAPEGDPDLAPVHLPWERVCPPDLEPTEVDDAPRGDDLAVLPFTSGTSGRPKGVALTHDNLTWSMVNGLACLPVDADTVTLIATPLAHVAVLGGLPQYTWACRGTVVLAAGFEAGRFIDLVRDHGVTTAFTVPAMMALLARDPRFGTADLDSLRWVLAGGSPALSATTLALHRRGVRVVNSYGLTETGGGVTYADADDVADAPASVGRPVPHVELDLVDETGAQVPDGWPGEILLRGPSIAACYRTATDSRPAVDPDGWLHTGDRARRDEHGRLEVVGRVKDTIITGGENVDPAEVENVLADLPGVLDVAVAGAPHPVYGEVITAYLVTDGRPVTVDDLRAHVSGRLVRHKWPRTHHVVEALPRSATGKLLRARLNELAEPAPSA